MVSIHVRCPVHSALLIGTLAAYGLSRFTVETGELPWYIALGRLALLVAVLLHVFVLWARLGLLSRWYGFCLSPYSALL